MAISDSAQSITAANTSTSPTPASRPHLDSPFFLENLPVELRIGIYENLPISLTPLQFPNVTLMRPTLPIQILQCSRSLHKEAKPFIDRRVREMMNSKGRVPRIVVPGACLRVGGWGVAGCGIGTGVDLISLRHELVRGLGREKECSQKMPLNFYEEDEKRRLATLWIQNALDSLHEMGDERRFEIVIDGSDFNIDTEVPSDVDVNHLALLLRKAYPRAFGLGVETGTENDGEEDNGAVEDLLDMSRIAASCMGMLGDGNLYSPFGKFLRELEDRDVKVDVGFTITGEGDAVGWGSGDVACMLKREVLNCCVRTRLALMGSLRWGDGKWEDGIVGKGICWMRRLGDAA